jgi:hypothetical protein
MKRIRPCRRDKRDNWKINFALAIFSIVLSLYSVELVLFIHNNISQSPTVEIDTRSKIEILEDLREEGVDAWPQVLSWLFIESNGLPSDKSRIFPLGGISQKTIVYCNESGQYKIFESDEHGFNNPRGLYKKGTIKVALVGDSFTLGSCVMSGEDITSRLREIGINALNLGNGGNGPLIELAVLKEYVEPIQPEIVLWLYYEGNDLLDLEREQKAPILMHYLEDNYSQGLLYRQNEIDAALIRYVNSQWVKKRFLHRTIPFENTKLKKNKIGKFLKIIKLWHLRSKIKLLSRQMQIPKHKTNFKTQLSLFSEIMATANKRVSNWGGKLYFVYLPTIERYVNNNNTGNFYDREDVVSIVNRLGIPLIDFHKVLDKHPDPLSLVPFVGAHYNAEGYKLVSELIADRLRRDGLIR